MALTLLEPIIVNTAANFTFANASITANITAGNVKTDNLLYANGSPYIFTSSAGGSNTQVQFNDANSFAGSPNFTFNKVTSTLTVNNIVANGAGLTALNGSNITGQVANALVAGTVYTAAQPNITSVGTLTGLGVNATVTAVGFTSNTGIFTGNGSGLTNITGANVTGTVPNATYSTSAGAATTAGTVTTAAQPNITSVGLLTALSIGPNSSLVMTGTSGYVRANSIQGTDGVAAIYPAYSGVTGAVGVTGNLTVGIGIAANITANGNVTANYFIGNGSSLSGITAGNISGQVANALVAGTVYTTAQPNITSLGTLTSLTSNGTVNFINASNVSLGAVGNVKITGGTSGQYLQTDGAGNLSWATVTSGSTSNISNGTSNVNIPATNGNINLSVAGNANIAVVTGTGVNISGTLNATGNANVGNIGATNGVFTNVSGNGSLLTSITGGNVTGQVANALVAGTVYTAAQPNITSVGTLTDLSVSGNTTISGNLTVGGSTTYINVTSLEVKDPIIGLGGGANGGALSSNDGKDRGTLLHYYTSAPVDAFMGWDTSNSEFAFGSNVTVASDVVTFNTLGNVRANYFIGNGSSLGSLTGANVTGTVANATNASALLQNTSTSTTVYPTFTTSSANGNSSAVFNTNITANLSNASITATTFVGSLSGAATTAGTVTTAAQPNITSIGTLTGLTSNGTVNFTGASNVSLGAIGNVKITGGTANYVLQTDGAGNLSWAAQSGGGGNSISNGTSNVSIPIANGNVTVGINGFSNIVVISESGIDVPGEAGNITGANYVVSNFFTGTLTTNAQPNVTSLGNLSALTVAGTSSIQQTTETVVTLSGASGVVTHDFSSGGVFYHSSISGSFTPNFTNVPTTTNRVIILALILNQGSTAYVPGSTIQIDGVSNTVLWAGGTAPAGIINGINTVTYALTRIGSSWIVTGSSGSYS